MYSADVIFIKKMEYLGMWIIPFMHEISASEPSSLRLSFNITFLNLLSKSDCIYIPAIPIKRKSCILFHDIPLTSIGMLLKVQSIPSNQNPTFKSRHMALYTCGVIMTFFQVYLS